MPAIMISDTARIGLINLIPALRLMENYKTVISNQILDESASGCLQCPNYASCMNHSSSQCISCTQKVYTIKEEKKYINEKNRYGYKVPLKRNALLLLLHLHFLHPDNKGLVQIDLEYAAETIHCDERTIRNNLSLLHRLHYITLQKGLYPRSCRAFIQSYPEYFNTAEAGGRGYFVMSKETFIELTKEHSTNALRLELRMLASSVDSTTPHYLHHETTYQDFRQLLPGYCCNKTIKNLISSDTFKTLFKIVPFTYTVIIDISEKYNPQNTASQIIKDCISKIDDCMKSIAEKARKLGFKKGKNWFLSNQEKNDIAKISLQYHSNYITQALMEIYDTYILEGRPIKNIGALVRTITSRINLHHEYNM